MNSGEKSFVWLKDLAALITDIRVIVVAFLAAAGTGGGMWAWGDAGGAQHVTALQADSIAKANTAPLHAQQRRQDTALIKINFRLEVMMTDDQKHRADSLMRAALRNINYGGSP